MEFRVTSMMILKNSKANIHIAAINSDFVLLQKLEIIFQKDAMIGMIAQKKHYMITLITHGGNENTNSSIESEEIFMKAINIKWDTDGDMELFNELPTEMEIPKGMIDEEEISDYLTDETGFCHEGFEIVN